MSSPTFAVYCMPDPVACEHMVGFILQHCDEFWQMVHGCVNKLWRRAANDLLRVPLLLEDGRKNESYNSICNRAAKLARVYPWAEFEASERCRSRLVNLLLRASLRSDQRADFAFAVYLCTHPRNYSMAGWTQPQGVYSAAGLEYLAKKKADPPLLFALIRHETGSTTNERKIARLLQLCTDNWLVNIGANSTYRRQCVGVRRELERRGMHEEVGALHFLTVNGAFADPN